MNKREQFIDYGKAIMIILVVLTHAGISFLNNLGYIMMTYFFMVSGYCYTKGKRSVKESIWIRFKGLLVPFWIAMLVYAVFEIFRASIMGYGDASIFLPGIVGLIYGAGHNLPYFPGISDRILEIMSYKSQTPGFVDVILPTNCHLWFLPAMFCGAVIFVFFIEKIRRSLKDSIWFVILMVLLASTGTLPFMIQLPYGLGRGFFACACMIIGYEFKTKDFFAEGNKHIVVYIIMTAAAIGLYFLGAGQSALVRSVYGPYGMLGTFITFAGGICACIVIVALLKKVNNFNLPIAASIGRSTMVIYSWHMIFLTVFSLLLLKIFNVEMARDEFFMSIIPEDQVMLMILVMIISVACCMLADKIFRKKI